MKRIKSTYLFLLLCCFSTTLLANNDPSESNYLMVVKNFSVFFSVAEASEELTEYGIVADPSHGTIEWNSDNTISYIPNKDVCEEVDAFTYFYSNGENLDTLTVYVEILCEALTIINGFNIVEEEKEEKDPNTFTIIGIENFPRNTLYIFNDTGNQIYYKEGYSNEWDGTNEGYPLLEDTTYYYVFNDGIGNTYSGYINVN